MEKEKAIYIKRMVKKHISCNYSIIRYLFACILAKLCFTLQEEGKEREREAGIELGVAAMVST